MNRDGNRTSPYDPEAGPAVSCIIVSYNSAHTLDRCLESLASQREDPPLEVIVVDNASQDGTAVMVREKHDWVRLIAHAENLGFARAANSAMQVSSGEHVLLLNPDTVVPQGALSEAVEQLERDPAIGMVGLKLVRDDGTFDHACKRGLPTVSSACFHLAGLHRLFPRSRRFAAYTAGHLAIDESGYVEAINGAFMLIRGDALDAVGELDERYWLYGEDLDWCLRFGEHGWKILYWPGKQVLHVKGASSGRRRSSKANRAFHHSMWLYYSKNLAASKPAVLSMIVRVGIWSRFLVVETHSRTCDIARSFRRKIRLTAFGGPGVFGKETD